MRRSPSIYDAAAQQKLRPTPPDRFWAKVRRGEASECWLWTGAHQKRSGEPVIHVRANGINRTILAKCVAWDLQYGVLDAELVVTRSESCESKSCVNPNHMKAILRSEHKRQLFEMLRQTVPAFSNNRGANHPRSKLTEAQVTELRQAAADGVKHRDLAEKYGVSEAVISRIVNNKSWVTPKQD